MTRGNRLLGALLLTFTLVCAARAAGNADAVFVGTSPCTEPIRPLLGIPRDKPADLMKWTLVLRATGEYTLRCEYGPAVQGTKDVGNPTVVERQGKWTTRGAVYELNGAVSLAKVGDDVLHVLNADRTLMVGNGGWSYTLNRADAAEKPGDREAALANPAGPEESYRIAPPATGPGVLGVFDGRTPCHGIARAIKSERADERDCWKLKWRLTLNQDPATRSPTTYKIEGSLFRQTPREGKWSIVRGTAVANDANATVYRLEPARGQATLNLLKGGDDVVFLLDADLKPLVGHEDFSYTLNRVTKDNLPAASR